MSRLQNSRGGKALTGGMCVVLGMLPMFSRAQTAPPAPPTTTLSTVNVIGSTPLLGSGVDADKVPGQTNVLTAKDLAAGGLPNLTRALAEQVGGVTLDNAAGNPFQPDLFYHGFRASALQGVEQGLAVYVNGVRFNQAFGDTVNWDLLPADAIDQVNLEGSNPAFGLNAIGGALNVRLKNGFTYHGGAAAVFGGSFGRIQGTLQYGKQVGNVAAYFAASVAHEDGWRDFQSSELQNFHGDVGWRNDTSDVHVTLTAANSRLGGPGTAPVELIAANPASQFTGPNQVNNRYLQFAINGNTQINDATSVQANVYYTNFLQRVINGNTPSFQSCNDGSGFLCGSPGVPLTGRSGNPIPDYLNGGPYNQLDQQTTVTNGYGAAVQGTNTSSVFGLGNQIVGGLSFDGAFTTFDGSSTVGGSSALSRNFIGPGFVIDQADGSIAPVRVNITTANYGVFVADTLDLTSRLSATVSGRFNAAEVDLPDQIGTALNGNHSYNRFNPAAGLAYKVTPWLTAYAGYSEANRAPTPAELSCASVAAPCSLANFFVGDPNLKQVVAHTVEAGVRGSLKPFDDATLSYDVGLFHSDLDDDIAFVNSVILGRAFFQNVGATRRQGVDASVKLTTPRWQVSVGYSYTDATFRNGFVEAGGSNPAQDPNGNITIRPGNRLPGIPANQVKFGVSYKVTDAWTVGATGVGVTSSYLFGDEANLTPKLPGYFVVNLSTSYQITDHIQLFGSIENVTNQRYYVYGTFSPTSSVAIAQAPNASNPRSYNIAAPIGGFGGVRVTF
jgi:outer membrane receptor protein involved in Fe transport